MHYPICSLVLACSDTEWPSCFILNERWIIVTDRLSWWWQEKYIESWPLILCESLASCPSTEFQGKKHFLPNDLLRRGVKNNNSNNLLRSVLGEGVFLNTSHSLFLEAACCVFLAYCMCMLVFVCLKHVPAYLVGSCTPPRLLYSFDYIREGVLKRCDGELRYLLISVTCWYYKSICLSCKIAILRSPLCSCGDNNSVNVLRVRVPCVVLSLRVEA